MVSAFTSSSGAGGRSAGPVLHGVGSSGRTWEWLPDELTRGRRNVRVDLRGHGRSDNAPGTYVLRATAPTSSPSCARSRRARRWSSGTRSAASSPGGSRRTIPDLVTAALLEDPPLLAGETPKPEVKRFRDVFHAVKAVIIESRERGLTEEETAQHIGAIRWGSPGARRSARS